MDKDYFVTHNFDLANFLCQNGMSIKLVTRREGFPVYIFESADAAKRRELIKTFSGGAEVKNEEIAGFFIGTFFGLLVSLNLFTFKQITILSEETLRYMRELAGDNQEVLENLKVIEKEVLTPLNFVNFTTGEFGRGSLN